MKDADDAVVTAGWIVVVFLIFAVFLVMILKVMV